MKVSRNAHRDEHTICEKLYGRVGFVFFGSRFFSLLSSYLFIYYLSIYLLFIYLFIIYLFNFWGRGG